MNDAQASPNASRGLAYLKLLRIPNVFTAVADIMMGYAFANPALDRIGLLMSLIGSSCCLYLAGMVLNDVFDFETDRHERPDRPLPSGQISRRKAALLGTALLAAGVAVAWSVHWSQPQVGMVSWRAGAIATVLAGNVLLYDGFAKKTFLGPVAMGGCRLLNVLLGMSVDTRASAGFDFSLEQWLVAAGMGIYVTGLTWFARHEAETSRRSSLICATGVMIVGVVCLAAFPYLGATPVRFTHPAVWPALLFAVTLSVWRRAFSAVRDPSPTRVQGAIKSAIMTLILLNAALCLAIAPSSYALAVVGLLIPSLLLGHWIYST